MVLIFPFCEVVQVRVVFVYVKAEVLVAVFSLYQTPLP